MIPAIAVPNTQVAPTLQSSIFSGQIIEPAIGRLPVASVSQTIAGARVADDGRSQQQSRVSAAAAEEADAIEEAFPFREPFGSFHTSTSFSTPFIAQLFGQLAANSNVVATLSGKGTGAPLGFVDFDKLAEYDAVKYKPSNASRPSQSIVETPLAADAEAGVANLVQEAAPVVETARPAEIRQPEMQRPYLYAAQDDMDDADDVSAPTTQAAPAKPVEIKIDEKLVAQASVTSSPVDAYQSTQSRNIVNLRNPIPTISIVF